MIKPYIRRGGIPGQETYYLNVPRDIAEALEITKDDRFELKINKNGDDITLCYKRVRKTNST